MWVYTCDFIEKVFAGMLTCGFVFLKHMQVLGETERRESELADTVDI